MQKTYTQCDRCGSVYARNEAPKSWSRLKFYENAKLDLFKARDLCIKCSKDFLDFMKNKGE